MAASISITSVVTSTSSSTSSQCTATVKITPAVSTYSYRCKMYISILGNIYYIGEGSSSSSWTTSKTITGLTPKTSYTISVRLNYKTPSGSWQEGTLTDSKTFTTPAMTYVLTCSYKYGSTSLDTKTYNIEYGTTVNPSSYDKSFSGYTLSSRNPSTSFTMSSAKTITYTYSLATYSVTYSKGDGAGTPPTDSTEYNYGNTVTTKSFMSNYNKDTDASTLSHTYHYWDDSASYASSTKLYRTPRKQQYWTWNGRYYNAGSTVTITSNITFTAQWTNNGSAFWYYSAITAPNPTRTGYTFNGWYSSRTYTTKIVSGGNSWTPTSSTDLYDKWTANSHTLYRYFKCNGGTIATTESSSYSYGASVDPTWFDKTIAGYTLSSRSPSSTFSMPDYDTSITYTYTRNTYSVTYSKGDGAGTPPTDSNTYYYNGSATAKAFMSSYNRLDSTTTLTHTYNWYTGKSTTATSSLATYTPRSQSYWSWNGGYYNAGSTVTITSNVTLTAQWSNGTQYLDPSSITLPTPSQTGYTFQGWYTDSSYTNFYGNAGDTKYPVYAITLYAKWEEDMKYRCRVNYYDESGNFIESETQNGKTYNFTAKSRSVSGYRFKGWSTSSGGQISVYAGDTIIVSNSNYHRIDTSTTGYIFYIKDYYAISVTTMEHFSWTTNDSTYIVAGNNPTNYISASKWNNVLKPKLQTLCSHYGISNNITNVTAGSKMKWSEYDSADGPLIDLATTTGAAQPPAKLEGTCAQKTSHFLDFKTSLNQIIDIYNNR